MLRSKSVGALMGAMVISLASLSADVVHPNGCKGPTLCTSSPVIDNCGWSFDVGLILEQMRISNTDVAYHFRDGGAGTAANPTVSEQMINLDFDLEPGLRVGVGYMMDHDDWMLRADFEWLYSKGSFNNTIDTGAYFPTHTVSLFSLDTSVEPSFQTIKSSLEVDYFLLDVYLSRGSYLSGKFSYEPFAGIKASWINYKGSRAFSNARSTAVLAANTSWLNRSNIDFWGVGPLIGMNGNYHVCAGWSGFSSANFAVLFGESHVKDYIGFVTTESYPGDYLARAAQVVLCPTLRTIIGVQYDKDMFCETQHFMFRAGFDGRYYFNQYPIIERTARKKREGNNANEALTNGPNTIENGSWGMLGLILDVGYDF